MERGLNDERSDRNSDERNEERKRLVENEQ